MVCRRQYGSYAPPSLLAAVLSILVTGASAVKLKVAADADADEGVQEDYLELDSVQAPRVVEQGTLPELAQTAQTAEDTATANAEADLQRRQQRMEVLERAETESLLREQSALEALEKEQAQLASKELQLEAAQRTARMRMKALARKAMPRPITLMQELHNEWYHLDLVRADGNNSSGEDNETLTDANEKEMPQKNKLLLQVINVFGLGFWGIDRCYMDQPWIGLLKMLTIGGMSIWAFIDWCILTENALSSAKTIDSLGFYAEFESGVDSAFWLALFNLIFAVGCAVYQFYTTSRAVQEQLKMQQEHAHPLDAEMPGPADMGGGAPPHHDFGGGGGGGPPDG
eukprot:TRINITY_DN14245_c0_g1_i1.p1 TRINITY_DN14245_c0_g1~~TRINITY_DN14245_c0_g1_i1.p1  ORF type:complete len:343 (+),score=103.40 TRINITY_DN14245_c0_g1_i1:147-1175(+)